MIELNKIICGDCLKIMKPKIYCSKCNSEITIKLWGNSKWWGYCEEFWLPHRNASHRCNNCEELWFSSDFIVEYNDGYIFTR